MAGFYEGGTQRMTMYLVEGRAKHETRGQYVLTLPAAYKIYDEMKKDFQSLLNLTQVIKDWMNKV